MMFFHKTNAPIWIILTNVIFCFAILMQFGFFAYVDIHHQSSQMSISIATKKLRTAYKPPSLKVIPIIYVITPTYTRLIQKAELTRLSTLFRLVGNIHWIVIEDSDIKTNLVTNFLKQTGLNSTHLNAPTPQNLKVKKTHRGAVQRDAGVQWLRSNRKSSDYKGVVYFADDDNTYSPELFEEIRHTKKVSVFPVGLVGKLRYESAIVKNGKVIGWHTLWHRKTRKFAVDMAGFAVNLNLIIQKKSANFDLKAKPGYLETYFLEHLGITLNDLEPRAQNCTKVLVWHTRTQEGDIGSEKEMLSHGYEESDLSIEI